jgi:hypothetical protein
MGHIADDEVEDVPTNNTNIEMDINSNNIRATSIDINLNASPIRPVEIPKFLKRHDSFSNVSIAYEILSTISMNVASVKQSFSKLKLLRSYLCSLMKEKSLTDLRTISLASEELENIEYEHLIEDFISRNIKRMMLFK